MYRKPYSWIMVLLVFLLLTSLACNLTSAAEPTATPLPPPADTAEPEPTAEPELEATAVVPPTNPLAVNTLEDVKLATIQIEAQGTFIDPQFGLQMNVPGRGSGFIIDESGIAITNNHVVTGAGLLRVWVGGESEPRNARILAVSECSDLAVIDLEGEGYHFLEWYEGNITPGLDIYAAGFPLGDPEYTLTRGIVSKEKADGETDWASVNSVIEHDATINPGNSGGPLVTPDGKVVAVNYAGSQTTNQYFAISQAEVMAILDQLLQEQNVTSLGVNGMAISDGAGLSGIWVSSVESGSPADKAGIEGGDIITLIEDIPLATDGTMADYCDILRSHGANDTLSVQVLRYDTEEVLEGQINGSPLAQAFSFAQELGDEVADTPPPSDTGDTGGDNASPTYTDYMSITDDAGAITMEVPAEWGDVDGSLWEVDGEVMGSTLVASSNLDNFYNDYDTPGVIFLASEAMAAVSSVEELLELGDSSADCVYEGRYDYEDAVYTGAYDLYSGCGGSDSLLVVLAAFPEDYSYATLLFIQAVTDADLAAADHILDTFVVIDELPGSTGGSSGSSGNSSGSTTTEVTLEVINAISESIWYIYISPSNSDSWGDDWLGGDILPVDGSYYFTLPPGTYDMAAYNSNEDPLEVLYQVDLSSNTTWTVDGDDGSSGGNTPTNEVTLEVVNAIGEDVWYIYISPSTSDSWGDDWLGGDILPVNSSYYFTLSPGTYDMAAYNSNEDPLEVLYQVDLSGTMTWTVDGDDGSGSNRGDDGLATLEIINASGEPIWYVYITDPNSDSWGGDWLDDVVIFENERFTVSLPPGIYDMKADNADDNLLEDAYNIEVVGQMTWTVDGIPDSGAASLIIYNQTDREVCAVYIIEDLADRGPNQLEDGDTVVPGTSYSIWNIPMGSVMQALALDCNGEIVGQNLDGFYFDRDLEWTLGQ